MSVVTVKPFTAFKNADLARSQTRVLRRHYCSRALSNFSMSEAFGAPCFSKPTSTASSPTRLGGGHEGDPR